MKLKSFALTVFTVGIATISVSKAQAADLTFTTVLSGLDNPRGIAFDQAGNLYVANSGAGGDGSDGRCIPSPSSQYIPLCAAENGTVVKLATDGTKTTVLSNLASIALSPYGEQAAGPADIKFDSQGNAYLLTGLAGNPGQRDTVLKEPSLGQLYKVDLATGSLTSLADFGSYELKYNPDGTDIISNPYAFAIKGDNAYVVDGGGNSIYKVALDGSGIKDVKAFPQLQIPVDQLIYPPQSAPTSDPGGTPPAGAPPAGAPPELPPGYVVGPSGIPASQQSVPTGITVAPDGSLTVSEYSYYPYPEGKARIFDVGLDSNGNFVTTGTGVGDTQLTGTEIATGFTQLTGVAYDSQGNEYVLQHVNQSEWKAIEQGGNLIGDPSGSLIKITPDGTRTTLLSGNGLQAASGITVGPDGDLYIANNARFADGKGSVIKIDPRTKVPEPSSAVGLLALSALGVNAAIQKRKSQQKVAEKLLVKVEVL
ncbi:MAG: ScyD/ScyE family protein [Stigonema ocellatum SAG 48.90 = DSM 106950]|nr:ScyD/ScyE family protein [Stigonema ocellatum SAG 48.90 = DSM 106950]